MSELWMVAVFYYDICWLPEADGTIPIFLPKFLLEFSCKRKSVIHREGQQVKQH